MIIHHDVSLSGVSTFNIGGIARQIIYANSPETIIEAIQFYEHQSIAYRVFAGGSNIIFPDEGIDTVLIRYLGGASVILDHTITADAGMLLMEVINTAISLGFSGLETLSGIPGTVGGAIVGNAGAYGHSIAEVIKQVEIWNGEIRLWLEHDECHFAYRESMFKHKPYIVLRALLHFDKGDESHLRKISQDIITKRKEKYHPGLKCPGSFFKNVLVESVSQGILANIDQSKIISGKIPAGYLLTEVGAKGMGMGGIEIADFHGNLFINRGNGKASEVKKLASILKQKVQSRFGIMLEEEVRYF